MRRLITVGNVLRANIVAAYVTLCALCWSKSPVATCYGLLAALLLVEFVRQAKQPERSARPSTILPITTSAFHLAVYAALCVLCLSKPSLAVCYGLLGAVVLGEAILLFIKTPGAHHPFGLRNALGALHCFACLSLCLLYLPTPEVAVCYGLLGAAVLVEVARR